MSTFKKLLALTLALAMVLSVSAFAGSYKADTYKDAASIDEDAEGAIELLYALDIMKGDENGNFNATATITRAEMAKMIYVILNYGNDDKAVNYTGAKLFSDVPAGIWYEGYVNYCATTKLVQGYQGKFNPNAPITCAEAAKMLLTAIGYSAEARGYTGANWAQNVLSDAAILGLLEGYKYNTNTYAPRQWVAVMVENMLYCRTYTTMAPTFSGLLVSGDSIGNTVSMGQKYYKLNTFTGYLYATDSVYIDYIFTCDNDADNHEHTYPACDHTTTADDDCVLLYNSTDGMIEVDNAGVGYMDLGKQYRVIYKNNGSVYSMKETGKSEVADSIEMDIEVENTYATNKNDANNKYIFTIGDMEAKFNTYTIKGLKVDNKNNTGFETINAGDVRTAAGTKSADLYRAIDKDGDGDIDYMIVVDYTYGQVTKVAEHKNYGEYFDADVAAANKETFKPTGFTGTHWYLDDVVNTEDEIAKYDVIKVTYNPDNGKYDVEVLDVASDATYTKRTTKGVHTIGDVEYVVGVNGFEAKANEKILVSGNLKEQLNVAYDGELVILVELVDSNYDDLADINAQLVMVTDAYVDLHSNPDRNKYYIDYMTIDGEMHKDVTYIDGKDDTDPDETDDDANVNFNELIKADGVAGADDDGYLDLNQRLFALRESGDGVYLIKLDAGNAKSVLDYSSSLLSGYREDDAELDTEDNELTFEGESEDFVENENSFFVAYKRNGTGSIKFAVMTLDEMGENDDLAVYTQALYKSKSTYDNYLAGYFWIPNLSYGTDYGYLYSTTGGAYDIDDDYWYVDDVFFSSTEGDEGETIQIAKIGGAAVSSDNEVEANRLYKYEYEKVNGEKVYYLTLIDETDNGPADGNRIDTSYNTNSFTDSEDRYEIAQVYNRNGDNVVVGVCEPHANEKLVLSSSCDIVLKKVVLDRDESQSDSTDELYFDIDTEIAFIDFSVLESEDEDPNGTLDFNVIDGESDSTYNYYSDYYYTLNSSGKVNMLYVITYAVEIEANID